LGLAFVSLTLALAWRPTPERTRRVVLGSLVYLPALLLALALWRGGP
jgi:hypothetical protein